MFLTRFGLALFVILASFAGVGPSWADGPIAEEMALRDEWVRQHFPPPRRPEPAIEPLRRATARLVVWTSYGPVSRNKAGELPLAIADKTYSHGLYCHAPSCVQVYLPGPAKSFSCVAGILTNPNSQGGSVVCSVKLGEREVYASPVLRRGEPGVPVNVDLAGATEFLLCTGMAGDGISSDQAVWGEATVTMADGKTLRLGDLPVGDAMSNPRPSTALPFSFTYDGRHSDQFLPQWKFEEQPGPAQPGRTTRVRTYTDPKTGLAVRVTVTQYTDYPTVEWTLSFKNTSDRDTPILSGILPLDARLQRGPEGEFLLHHFTGSPCTPGDYEPFETPLGPKAEIRIQTEGGRPTNTNLPYFNVADGNHGGVIAVLGWAGQWAARFGRDDARGLRIAGGQQGTFFRLRPGEEVRAPLAVLQFYRGDWIHAQNVWRRWMLAHNVPRREGKLLSPFIFVCFGNFYPGLMTDAATERKFLDRCFEEKIQPDYWNQDAGWYQCQSAGWWMVGTWDVDRTRWPKGLREVSDWLRTKGVKTITWFEPERLAPGTWLAENHPEWCYGGAAGGLMKLGDPAFRQWITDRVSQRITSEGIDFYRQDFNIDPLIHWRANDEEDRQGITEIRHVEGYFAFWDELIRRHPSLWIDSCASGGRRNDLETLRRAVPILRSDWAADPSNPATDPSHQQNHTYGISFWMPYNGTGYMTVDKYLVRSAMTPIHGIGPDLRRKDIDYDLLRKLYGEARQVQPYLLGDYYPLTLYCRGTDAWVAWQFDRPEQGDGLVQAFRRQQCAEGQRRFKLRGLDPKARYQVTDLDAPGAPKEYTGAQLAGEGLPVTLDAKPAAAVMTYRRLQP